jgi:hypothetical protein
MFHKILILIFIIKVSIECIESLSPEHLCSSKICNGNCSYQCTNDLCTLNAEKCDEYYSYKRYNSFRSLHLLRLFQKQIKKCKFEILSTNDYCLKKTNCYELKFVYTVNGFIQMKKKFDCKCQGRNLYKCGDFCTLNKKYCEILDIKIQNEKYFNDLNLFQNCALDKI